MKLLSNIVSSFHARSFPKAPAEKFQGNVSAGVTPGEKNQVFSDFSACVSPTHSRWAVGAVRSRERPTSDHVHSEMLLRVTQQSRSHIKIFCRESGAEQRARLLPAPQVFPPLARRANGSQLSLRHSSLLALRLTAALSH